MRTIFLVVLLYISVSIAPHSPGDRAQFGRRKRHDGNDWFKLGVTTPATLDSVGTTTPWWFWYTSQRIPTQQPDAIREPGTHERPLSTSFPHRNVKGNNKTGYQKKSSDPTVPAWKVTTKIIKIWETTKKPSTGVRTITDNFESVSESTIASVQEEDPWKSWNEPFDYGRKPARRPVATNPFPTAIESLDSSFISSGRESTQWWFWYTKHPPDPVAASDSVQTTVESPWRAWLESRKLSGAVSGHEAAYRLSPSDRWSINQFFPTTPDPIRTPAVQSLLEQIGNQVPGSTEEFPVPFGFSDYVDFNNPEAITLTPTPPTPWWRTPSLTPARTVGIRSVTYPPRTLLPDTSSSTTTTAITTTLPTQQSRTSTTTRIPLATTVALTPTRRFPSTSSPITTFTTAVNNIVNEDPFPLPDDFTIYADIALRNKPEDTQPPWYRQPEKKVVVLFENQPFPVPDDFSLYADHFTPIRFTDFVKTYHPKLKSLVGEITKSDTVNERNTRYPQGKRFGWMSRAPRATTSSGTLAPYIPSWPNLRNPTTGIQTGTSASPLSDPTATSLSTLSSEGLPGTDETSLARITSSLATREITSPSIQSDQSELECARSQAIRFRMQEGKGELNLSQNSSSTALNITATFQWLPLGFYQLWVSKRNPYTTDCNPTTSFGNVMIHLKDFVSHYKGGPPVVFEMIEDRLTIFGNRLGPNLLRDKMLFVFRGKPQDFGRRPVFETMFRGLPPSHMSLMGCGYISGKDTKQSCE